MKEGGLRVRDQGGSGYFYTSPPALVPAAPGALEHLDAATVVGAVEGGVLIGAKTVTGAPISVALRLVGDPPMLRCTLSGAEDLTSATGLALPAPPCNVELSQSEDTVELRAAGVTLKVDLQPFRLELRSGELVLSEDRSTGDPNDVLLVLPLGFTPLAGGGRAYHETFFAEPDEHFYGFGEKFTAFDKRGQLISCWNQDALGCADEHSYKNVPFFVSSRGYAVFVDTTAYAQFDMCHSVHGSWSFVVPDEQLDYYILLGGPRQCLAQYQQLVGGPTLPPSWSFGVWISTGFFEERAERARQRIADLQEHQFPCDVLHIDTYWQRFGRWSDLCWDREAFPDPPALLADVHQAGMHVSLWLNPYIGVESPLFEVGGGQGYFLRKRDGAPWVGALWGDFHPPVAVIDMTNPAAISWWAAMLTERLAEGVDVFKTDFGEAIPTEVVAFDGTPGELLHNRYSLLYNDVVFDALAKAGIERPVVWARSTWAGGQRHPVQWSGDSNSTWQDLAGTLRAGLSMAMSGHHFWSHDIGGFKGAPSPELFVRWAQFGLLSPFSRFHGTSSRLPWDFGAEALAAVRHVADVRVRLFPYLYSVAFESASAGLPIMRPMVFDYPRSADAQAADLQYLLGPDLLVAPVFRPGGQREVWFPPGRWVHYATGEVVDGPRWGRIDLPLETAPLWLRAGSVLPTLAPRLHVGNGAPACEELVVVGQLGGSGNLMVLDGATGKERLAQVQAEWSQRGLSLSGPEGIGDVRVLVVDGHGAPAGGELNGRQVRPQHAATLAEAWQQT